MTFYGVMKCEYYYWFDSVQTDILHELSDNKRNSNKETYMINAIAMHTTGEVARLLGIKRPRLQYLIERGYVPGPSQIVPGRWLFSDEDVEALRLALRDRAEEVSSAQKGNENE